MPPNYDRNVFINCPFDAAYRPLFEAVTFAVYDCGFYPRSALEVEDSTQVRIEKIQTIIRESRLAVHDISRTELDRITCLPRFNMPLELGIFLGAKAFGSREQKRKAAIVLDTQPFRYQKYISDIAGQDIRAHASQPAEAVRQVRSFLAAQREEGTILRGGDKLAERYDRFRRELPSLCEEMHLHPDKLTFRDLTGMIVSWLAADSLEPV